jgi:hypothetical protein
MVLRSNELGGGDVTAAGGILMFETQLRGMETRIGSVQRRHSTLGEESVIMCFI